VIVLLGVGGVLTAVAIVAVVAGLVLAVGARHQGSDVVLPPAGSLPSAADQGSGQLRPVHPGPAAGQLVVTPAMARQAVDDFWTAHATALHAKDLKTLGALSSGAARRWEVGDVACGCGDTVFVEKFIDAAYFVPRQTTYPAHFVAQVHMQYGGPDGQGVEILVFERTGPQTRWTVVEHSGYWPSSGRTIQVGMPLTDADGYLVEVPAQLRSRARTLATHYARAWQRTKETGRVSGSGTAEFNVAGNIKTQFDRVSEFRQDRVQRNGLVGHFRYYVDAADPLVVVPDARGFVLACQPVRETLTYSDRPGRGVYQDPEQRNWGVLLRPGTYPAITMHEAWQTCFAFDDKPADKVDVTQQASGGGWPVPASAPGDGASTALGAGPVAPVGREG
jgi:hypothetical protein